MSENLELVCYRDKLLTDMTREELIDALKCMASRERQAPWRSQMPHAERVIRANNAVKLAMLGVTDE